MGSTFFPTYKKNEGHGVPDRSSPDWVSAVYVDPLCGRGSVVWRVLFLSLCACARPYARCIRMFMFMHMYMGVGVVHVCVFVYARYHTQFKEPLYKGGRTKTRIPGWCDRVLYHSMRDVAGLLVPQSAGQ
jgi:hypothetical protein